MMKIDPRLQEGAAAVIAAAVVVFSWRGGYQQAVERYRDHQTRRYALIEQLRRMEGVFEAGGGTTAWLAHHEHVLRQRRARFVPSEQMPRVLDALVEMLKAGNTVRLVEMTPGNLEVVQEAGGPLAIDGLPCYRLPVAIVAEGRYHALLAALERVMAPAFPAFMSLERVELRLNDPVASNVSATIQLFIYVTGAPMAVASDA